MAVYLLLLFSFFNQSKSTFFSFDRSRNEKQQQKSPFKVIFINLSCKSIHTKRDDLEGKKIKR